MGKRVLWMLVGGLGVWLALNAKRGAGQVAPTGATDAALRLRNDLAVALAEGRRAKMATEQDLRQAAWARPPIDAGVRAAGQGGQTGARPGLASAGPDEAIPGGR